MSASLVGSEMCIRDRSWIPGISLLGPFCFILVTAVDPERVPIEPLSVSYTHLTLPTICSV
eukprot:12724001-Alexandrium_andersonii.AAC.1